VNHSSRFLLLGLTLALGACSTLEGDKVDYKSAGNQGTDTGDSARPDAAHARQPLHRAGFGHHRQ
jgi:hypothetical protein